MTTKKELKYAFNTVLDAVENIKCEHLSHNKKHQHKNEMLCPVEYDLKRQADIIRNYIKEYIMRN